MGDWCNENNRAMQHGKWEPLFRGELGRGIIHSNTASPPIFLHNLCLIVVISHHHNLDIMAASGERVEVELTARAAINDNVGLC